VIDVVVFVLGIIVVTVVEVSRIVVTVVEVSMFVRVDDVVLVIHTPQVTGHPSDTCGQSQYSNAVGHHSASSTPLQVRALAFIKGIVVTMHVTEASTQINFTREHVLCDLVELCFILLDSL